MSAEMESNMDMGMASHDVSTSVAESSSSSGSFSFPSPDSSSGLNNSGGFFSDENLSNTEPVSHTLGFFSSDNSSKFSQHEFQSLFSSPTKSKSESDSKGNPHLSLLDSTIDRIAESRIFSADTTGKFSPSEFSTTFYNPRAESSPHNKSDNNSGIFDTTEEHTPEPAYVSEDRNEVFDSNVYEPIWQAEPPADSQSNTPEQSSGKTSSNLSAEGQQQVVTDNQINSESTNRESQVKDTNTESLSPSQSTQAQTGTLSELIHNTQDVTHSHSEAEAEKHQEDASQDYGTVDLASSALLENAEVQSAVKTAQATGIETNKIPEDLTYEGVHPTIETTTLSFMEKYAQTYYGQEDPEFQEAKQSKLEQHVQLFESEKLPSLRTGAIILEGQQSPADPQTQTDAIVLTFVQADKVAQLLESVGVEPQTARIQVQETVREVLRKQKLDVQAKKVVEQYVKTLKIQEEESPDDFSEITDWEYERDVRADNTRKVLAESAVLELIAKKGTVRGFEIAEMMPDIPEPNEVKSEILIGSQSNPDLTQVDGSYVVVKDKISRMQESDDIHELQEGIETIIKDIPAVRITDTADQKVDDLDVDRVLKGREATS